MSETSNATVAIRLMIEPVSSDGSRGMPVGGGDLGLISGPIQKLEQVLIKFNERISALWEETVKEINEEPETSGEIILTD